uniref:Uncharacterized protein n=1 Tax=Amphimedon queenslandica TaxID=400682 RepID=A0A1X7UIE7_AMPQE
MLWAEKDIVEMGICNLEAGTKFADSLPARSNDKQEGIDPVNSMNRSDDKQEGKFGDIPNIVITNEGYERSIAHVIPRTVHPPGSVNVTAWKYKLNVEMTAVTGISGVDCNTDQWRIQGRAWPENTINKENTQKRTLEKKRASRASPI